MPFTSRLCQICKRTLQLAFEQLGNPGPSRVAHHSTKESLIDSVLPRSCHLCRFIVYHFRRNWAPRHRTGVEELREQPTSLSEDDFVSSDFAFVDFPNERKVIYSYLLDLPEKLNMRVGLNKYGDGSDGVFGIIEFTCDARNAEDTSASTQRFWVFKELAFGGAPITARPNESTSNRNCQSMLQEWLDQCDQHDDCKALSRSFMPTRLLDLFDIEVMNRVRLVLTQDLDRSAPYVTLSHCWGGNVPFQLREETMEKMKLGFDVKELPRTFQDAIVVARWANVRYIWIDSCCIVQDSASDWEREAKSMQTVYGNTYFNISAAHSQNSHGGCFTDRLAYKITPCPFDAPKHGLMYLLPQFNLTNPLRESALSERAWVTQERFLSPRNLHFTTDQLFWECGSLYACETFPKGVPQVYDNSTSRHYRFAAPHRLRDRANQWEIYQSWGRICEDYSRAKLTFRSDKLIAFAGIAREFESRLPNDIYLAGLWKRDLITGLLWKAFALDGWPVQANGSHEPNADPLITAAVPKTYRAPSWSWLGKDCCIFWQTRQLYSVKHVVTILDASVDLASKTESSGDILGGHITLRGCLRAAHWKQEDQIDSIIIDGVHADEWLVPLNERLPSEVEYFRLQRDSDMSFPLKDIFCLPVRLSLSPRATSHGKPIVEGLVLRLTDKVDIFERLGHFETLGDIFLKVLMYEPQEPWLNTTDIWEMLGLSSDPMSSRSENKVREQYQCDIKYLRQRGERVITIV